MRVMTLAAGIVLWLALGTAQADGQFETFQMHFEQNVRDQDAEVVLDLTGSDEGLASLQVTAPDGRTVVRFEAADSRLGIRGFKLESPEPKNDGRVQAAFPAGTYKVSARTVGGETLQGQTTLSHDLPAPASFVRPGAGEEGLPVGGLKLAWSVAATPAATVVVIEQEETGRELRVNLPGDATSFAVPDGFLDPGTEYNLAIGTVSEAGNASYIETGFTTAD